MNCTLFTEKEDEVLRANWGKIRAASIGAMIGRTKNSVIGRANRLGLPRLKPFTMQLGSRRKWSLTNPKPKGYKRPRRDKKMVVTRHVNKKGPSLPLVSLHEANKTGRRVRLFDLKHNHCRWVMKGRDDDGLAVFCGEPVVEEKSFCATHCGVVYQER